MDPTLRSSRFWLARAITLAAIAAIAAIAASTAVAAGGCSAANQTQNADAIDFPASAWMSLTSDSNAYAMEVRSSPQPPTTGLAAFELRISDTRGAPVDGLMVSVVPWMPAHGHGTSVVPSVSAMGNGRYVVTNVYLFMAGQWELRVTIDRGSATNEGASTNDADAPTDHATVSFEVD